MTNNQGGPGPQHKPRTLEEPPVDEIKELIAKGHQEAYLIVKQFGPKGMTSREGRIVALSDLLTDELPLVLQREYGGGKFLIDVRDPIERGEVLCTRFNVAVVASRSSALEAASALPPLGRTPNNAEQLQGYRFGVATGMPVSGVQSHEVAKYTSDEIAVQRANAVEEELKALRRESEARNKQTQAIIDQLRQQLAEERTRGQQQATDARLEALRNELQALRSQPPPKPALDPSLIVGALTALVPVITAFVSNSTSRQQLMLDAQKHASDQQFNMLTTLLTKKPEENAGMKAFMELLPKLLEARDPSKTADVIASMAESQLSTLHMTAQIMQQVMPEADSPGMAIVRQLTEGVMGFVEKAAEAQQAAQHVHQQRQMPQPSAQQQLPQQPSQQDVQVVASAPASAVKATNARQVRPKPRSAREIAQAIVADENWPADMKSAAWVRILQALHGEQSAVGIGEGVAQTLQGIQDIGETAEYLKPMFEDDGPVPSQLLRPLFAACPIGQLNPTKLEEILSTIDGMYSGDEGSEEEEAPQAQANGSAEALELPQEQEPATVS